ncbi:MAG: divergent polysaccharide deacetylase family protein [Campylobacterales bacterium]|nr:divergent polysaccharide deacetylase family protein [Campylobacterales bacterium]
MHKRRPLFSRLFFKRIASLLIIVALFAVALFVGYRIGVDELQKELLIEREQTRQLIGQIKEIAAIDESTIADARKQESRREDEVARLRQELQELLERERRRDALMPQHEYAPQDKKASPPPYARSERFSGTGPKLAIIIDDVSYRRDITMIRSTGLPLIMSFLPPSTRHPKSAELARAEAGYMVHLPLEAVDFNDEEPHTLRTTSTEEEIAKRISALKELYPDVRYMNNHTGSKFTADEAAMERLVRVLRKEGISFVDSRTTPETKVPAVSEKYGIAYRGRDVFLDHRNGVENVKKQISEAVAKAKRHGSAIAIGHPRPDTIQALIESRELLGEVQLVGIDQI